MRTQLIFTSLLAGLMILTWSCQQETVAPSDAKVHLRGGKGNGNGNGGANSGELEVCLTGGTLTCDQVAGPYACNTTPGGFLGKSYFAEFGNDNVLIYLQESGQTLDYDVKVVVKTFKKKGKHYIEKIRLLGQTGPAENVHKVEFIDIIPPFEIDENGFTLPVNACLLAIYEFDGPASDTKLDNNPRGWVSLGNLIYQPVNTGCAACPGN